MVFKFLIGSMWVRLYHRHVLFWKELLLLQKITCLFIFIVHSFEKNIFYSVVCHWNPCCHGNRSEWSKVGHKVKSSWSHRWAIWGYLGLLFSAWVELDCLWNWGKDCMIANPLQPNVVRIFLLFGFRWCCFWISLRGKGRPPTSPRVSRRINLGRSDSARWRSLSTPAARMRRGSRWTHGSWFPITIYKDLRRYLGRSTLFHLDS